MISQVPLSRYELLYEACRSRRLLPGQRAMEMGLYREYFLQYGLSTTAFCQLFDMDVAFRASFTDPLDWQASFREYGVSCGMRQEFCPQWIHLYESIQAYWPEFEFKYDPRELTRPVVTFVNYPCGSDGSRIPLLTLALHPEVLEGCRTEDSGRGRFSGTRSRRPGFMACGVWCA